MSGGKKNKLKPNRLRQLSLLVEKRLITRMLIKTQGNVAEAARLLNVNRTDMYKHMRRCGMIIHEREDFKYEQELKQKNLDNNQALRNWLAPIKQHLTNAK